MVRKQMALVAALAGATVTAAVVGAAGAATPAKAPAATAAAAGGVRVQAVLDSAHVKPRFTGGGAGAGGLFTATLDGTILRYTFTFSKLSGQAVSAQIHTGSATGNGPIAQPLCVPCLAPETGVVPLYPQQLADLKAGRLYVVVQTAAGPDGEIRGQLAIVK